MREKAHRERLAAVVRSSPALAPLLERWEEVALPDGWLAAGAIAQSVWNDAFGCPPLHGLDDIDLVYFDAGDLSEAAEAGHAARLRRRFAGLPVRLDVKNEARVHLWYGARFGHAIQPYASIAEAVATFPTTATAVALRPASIGLDVLAPFGLGDLLGCVVRPNKAQIKRAIYEAKLARWRPLWPGLRVVEW